MSLFLLLSFSVYFSFLVVSHDRAGLDGDEGIGFLGRVGRGKGGLLGLLPGVDGCEQEVGLRACATYMCK
jgi:hypothetical protein